MNKPFQAIFEAGVLKPLEPLSLNDRDIVTLVVTEHGGLSPAQDEWDDIIDHDAVAEAEKEAEGAIPLEELRKRLSSIRGSLSDVIIEERGDY